MINELLLLIKKHTDTLIEQTRTKPQETLEFKMDKQMQIFRLSLQSICWKKVNGYWPLVRLSVQIQFLISLTKTMVFQSLYQDITKTNLMKKILTI